MAKSVLIAALMVSIGLHWAVLQSAAWVSMVVSYSIEEGSVVDGLSNTFDGDHPCPLCHMVENGTKKEPAETGDGPTHPVKADQDLKLNLALVDTIQFIFSRPEPAAWDETSLSGWCLKEEPAAPPPKLQA